MTPEGFEKLLGCLDADREQAGERYEMLRRKLVSFFEWRGDRAPDEHADEVMNRIARRIEEGEEIRNFPSYVYGVAKMLWREVLKQRVREGAAAEQLAAAARTAEDDGTPQPRLECLDQCMGSLPAQSRELIIEYYQSSRRARIDRRKGLADRLGMPLNALRIRTHRIRAKIEECVNACLARPDGRVA